MFLSMWLSWSTTLVTLATWTTCGVAECNCKKTGYGIESKIPAGVRTEFQFQDTDTSEYSFGYDTGPENPSGHFRLEERMEDGSVRGRYGYTDPNGLLKIVEYFADDSGFHILNVKTQSPKAKQESKVIDHPEPFGPFLGVLPPFLQRYKSDLPSDNNKLDFAVNEI